MNSLISPDNHWVIWTILVGMAALTIYLEQKFLFVKNNRCSSGNLCQNIVQHFDVIKE
jgi:uncharacterized membrane protein